MVLVVIIDLSLNLALRETLINPQTYKTGTRYYDSDTETDSDRYLDHIISKTSLEAAFLETISKLDAFLTQFRRQNGN